MEAVRRGVAGLVLALLCSVALAAASAPPSVAVQGQPDGAVPGWALTTTYPAGWTADCCTYARAIGVNLVIYRGEWTGEPQRVMVLNVWPAALPSLDAEVRADRTHYLKHDPAAKVASFPLRHPAMACTATVYQGTDRVDDFVVFCDPGKAAGVRLSWSMTLAHADPQRRPLLEDFLRVAVATRYQRGGQAAPPTHRPGAR